MKKIAILLSLLLMMVIFLRRGKTGKVRYKNGLEGTIDTDMTGPGGEEVFIGSGGGRYFIRGGRKIFVAYGSKAFDAI